MRLDLYLKEAGFFESRHKAQEAIKKGLVFVDGKIETKPGAKINKEKSIEVKKDIIYVARSAEKLLFAVEKWKIDFKDKTVLDIGASTGGFTQVVLLKGAKKVYAVDIGSKQLHKSLKENKRVVNMEKTDFRNLHLHEKIDIALADLSFISTIKNMHHITRLLKKGESEILFLFKPQFEVGKENVKKGLARKDAVPESIKLGVEKLKNLGLKSIKCASSPVKGKKGNQEFLFYAKF